MPRRSVEDGVIFLGAMFLGLVTHLFNGFAELAMSIAKLPIFYKQRDLLFYPSWAYGLPTWILKIPISFLECAVWIGMTYYVIGFDPNIERHYLLLVLISQMASGLFRLLAALGREMVVADTFGSFAQLVLLVLGGFLISRGKDLLPHRRTLGKGQAVVSEEELKEKQANRTGERVELLPAGSTPATAKGRDGGSATRNASPTENRKKGMVLPFAPLSITFDDIEYSVDMPQVHLLPQHVLSQTYKGIEEDRLVLLKGVSGAFRPGVLTALMGVSGAGKTTLMDVLAGRKTGGYIDGSICISGYPKKQETFARISGYCEQNDIHSPHVTVYESLLYSAWLRLPPEVDTETRKVGTSILGGIHLSASVHYRLLNRNIWVQMFIEEVMELVELTSLRGALVGLPGVNGLSTEQRKRLTIAVELVANPSIIFMDEPTSGLDARAAAIVMRTVRNTVDTGRTVVCTIHQPSIDIFEAFDELFLMKRGGEEIYVGPLGRNSCHLINYFEGIEGVRKIKDGYNPATWMLEVTTLAQEEMLGVDFAETYKNSDLHRTTKQDLLNSLGSMYAAVLFIGIQNGQTVQPIVDVERTVFYREKAAGMYSALPYAFAQVLLALFLRTQLSVLSPTSSLLTALQSLQVLIEIPHIFLQTVVYGLIVYSMIGFDWTMEKFFWYLFFMFFTFMYFTFYGMMAVAMTPNSDIAAIVSTAFYAIWNIFAGFLIPRPFGNIETQMEDGGEKVADYIRRFFGFRHDFLGVVAVAVVGFTVLFAFVFAFSIKVFNFQRR
ncbi:hypothetical protein B296_00018839 [Ensete ventricosum]|uniref:ABC transporter domain-containing protein n=1 Tax=Ensete ventricosum TaxID=4639 RepID=A0A426ZH52_ENSVE|nr:hypothetical protein B296_00018839 [Ensete ventricosum]